MKIDYQKKGLVIASGYCDIEKFISKSIYDYFYKYDGENIDMHENFCLAVSLQEYCMSDNDVLDFYLESKKINHAFYKRKKRLFDTIQSMVYAGSCLFLTLTFSDETLDRLSQQTRRRYVTDFMKAHSDYYVANIDYGKENGREHYHAVIMCERVNFQLWEQNGFIFAETIHNSTKDFNKLSQYVSKLTNHAIKVTTRRQACIYSKKVNELVKQFKESISLSVGMSTT